ncbi:phosphatidylserine/phosphatidylglycerophosphate/cardiolipin synthase family protein [Erythrobacter sp. THAF29]|uniref:phospholipase D-like domain-containing protein n=1 Tax=Erythrobacter sp. THAF29 TaxID=2587851 RepID=UPI001267F568|nr:phosphatidylserine/phosphatidylglycerophosphate/cardiolipin synthase family protein [Erythrobacter sp. THAF29]QFT75946.1 Major cardiolipin synthase ClsA [Erythrobacter sp. THAF29]
MAEDLTPDPDRSPTSNYQDADSFQIEAKEHVFTFYPRGSDRFAALLDHIEKAQDTLRVFYYMFQHDEAGKTVRDALVAAVKRGVDVHLIIDAFGSDAPDHFFDPIVEAGGRFDVFSARWSVRYLVRNHQKFVIADGARVMTGGANISDHYYKPPEENGWCDLGVAIEGAVAKQFCDWFALLREWTESDGSQFRRIRNMVKEWDPGDDEPVQLLLGGPLVREGHWAYRFKKDMVKGQRLDLVTAYFAPPGSFRRIMARLAARGRARLITAGVSDIEATIDVARLYYKRLLKAGAKIREFQPCKLHMKLLVVDDKSYFGSANLDRRSIRINVELMVRVRDETLAERLREFIDHLERASVHIDDEWYRRHSSFFTRLRWRFFHFVNLADYTIARTAAD